MSPEPMPDDWERVLVVAAHPDDVEYGPAAAVATWTAAGRTAVYVMATSGEAGMAGVPPEEAGPLREDEQRSAAAEVGVDVVEFLGFPDGRLEPGPALRRAIAGAVRRHRPDLVVTGHFGPTWTPPGVWPATPNSADHRALGAAVLDAVADAGNEWIFRDLAEPAWSGVRWVAVQALHDPSHDVDVSAVVDRAVASLLAHRRYLEVLSDDPVEEQARSVVGRSIGEDRRVGFHLYAV